MQAKSKKGEKNEVAIIAEKVAPILEAAESVAITDAASMAKAVDILSQMNGVLDKIAEEREKVTKPLNEALKAERARWKPLEAKYEAAVKDLRGRMSEYQTAEIARQKEEEAKIAARVGEGKGKLKFETAVRKMDAIEKAEKSVATDSGAVVFVTVKKFEVMDITMLPQEFLLADEVKIRKAMLAGITVPGVRYYEVQQPRNSR